jgi:hypothetical protein
MVACLNMHAEDFRPARWLPGGHAQTIVPWLMSAPAPPGPGESRFVAVDPTSLVRVDIDRPSGTPRGTLLLVHGLSGCSRSSYVLRTAEQALARGWACARMNLRGAGDTLELTRSLYNALQSSDVGLVLDDLERYGLPRPLVAVGFSLGGAIVLRYAGLTGGGGLADAFVGVNPPVDMESSVRAIERPINTPYERYFVRRLCQQLELARRLFAVPGPPARPRQVRRLRRFDDLYTAPAAGLDSAEEYYAAGSPGPLLFGVGRPTLIVSARNDPFIPIDMFTPCHRQASSAVTFLHPRSGGHIGYWQRRTPRFWVAEAVLDFLDAVLAGSRVRVRDAVPG